MFKEYLLETYGYDEPIFVNEVKFEGMSLNAIRQAIKRLYKNGFLQRYDSGIYFIANKDRLLDKAYLDPFLVLKRKYLSNEIETYGYITGLAFANELKTTTQIPSLIEIVTNRETTNGRLVEVGPQEVRVKRPKIQINKENYVLLQFLDIIDEIEVYSELNIEDTKNILKKYIKDNRFKKEELIKLSPALKGDSAKKMIEWELVYEFA